jgi:hypothetical protein
MSYTSAINDLRNMLSDNVTDKLRYRKRCIGEVNGTNATFKTFEFRRVTNFATDPQPMGVYIDGVLGTVSADNQEVGEFTLSAAPLDGSVVEATYYVKYFIDAELDLFLQQSMSWLGYGIDFTTVATGLRPALLFYAAKQACEKLALRWAEHLSETYMLNDAPKVDARTPMAEYREMAKMYMDQAEKARKTFYQKNDQAEAVLFSSIAGSIRDVEPKR